MFMNMKFIVSSPNGFMHCFQNAETYPLSSLLGPVIFPSSVVLCFRISYIVNI
jgi:hypothetical protein